MKNISIIKLYLLLFAVSQMCFCPLSVYSQDDRRSFDVCEGVSVVVPSAADYGFVLPSLRAEFSKEGTLIRLGGFDMTQENGSYHADRDDSNRIVRLEFSAGDATRINLFSYDSDGRICEVKDCYVNEDTEENVLDTRMVRAYDNSGLPVKETYYNEDGSLRAEYTYKYMKVDDDGNWLSRTVTEPSQGITDEEESRQIIYTGASGQASAADKAVTEVIDSDIDKAVATHREANKGKHISPFEIILGLLFIALFAHSIYVLYVRKPSLLPLSPDSRLSQEESSQENEALNHLWEVYMQNSTPIPGDSEGLSVPTTRKQMDNIRCALQQVAELRPCSQKLIDGYNEILRNVNELECRQFSGSKWYLWVGGIVVAIVAGIRIFGDGQPIQGIVYFLFSFGAYWFGSQRPLYQLLGSEIKGGNRAGCMTSLIGSIFCFMGSGRTWITRYYDEIGRKVREEEDNSEHVMFPLLGLFGLFALGVFMPIVGLINYIRFYIINR